MWNTVPKILCAVFSLLLISGCSTQKLIVTSAQGVLDDVVSSLQREQDLEIAQNGLGTGIVLIEGMRASRPKNLKLAGQAVQARFSYCMGFVESKDEERARSQYRVAMAEGFELLERNEAFRKARETRDTEALAASLDRFRNKHWPLLFWTISSWAGWVNVSRDDPEATIQVDLVRVAIDHLIETDESYFFGSPHLMAGSFYSSRAPMFGGDPEKGKKHFERALELSRGQLLLAKVFMAELYCVQVQNRDLFTSLLQEVIDATVDSEDLQLLNVIAKGKAVVLLEKTDDLFF